MGDAYPAPPHPLRGRLVAQALLAGKEGEPQVREFLRRCVPQKRGTCYTMQAAFTIGYLTQHPVPGPTAARACFRATIRASPAASHLVAPSLSARGVRAKRRWRDGTATRATVRRPRSTASTSTCTSCCANRGANTEREQNRPGRAREGSRARQDGMENPFRVYGACGAPKQADSKLVGVVVQLRAPCPHPCKCIRRS